MKKICVLDYQSGNTRSVCNLFSSLAPTVLSRRREDILEASHLVLPGVGAFGAAMEKIQTLLPLDLIEDQVLHRAKPLLGICVGMQVLADEGEEYGTHRGLGWIPGVVRKLPCRSTPLPHVGWNDLIPRRVHPLMNGMPQSPDFYFVHSFAFQAANIDDVIAEAEYEVNFTAMIGRENLLGVQFHPEKSQRAGILLARNFLSL